LHLKGNLYYALTHSPEPLTREYAYALSWEAAGERLASAGCITKDESEALKEAIATTGTEVRALHVSLLSYIY
jgi:hypothetical protein